MWVFIFGFLVLSWIIIKNEKSFNRSIQILEDQVNQSQDRISNLEAEVRELRRK